MFRAQGQDDGAADMGTQLANGLSKKVVTKSKAERARTDLSLG
jgi:hypothetical protein